MEEDQDQRRADPASRRTPASNATGSILPPSPLDQRWFVHLNDKTYGPYSGYDIKKFAVEGRIRETDLLYLEGGSAWVEARSEPTLGVLFRKRDATPPPQPSLASTRTHSREEPSYASSDDWAEASSVKRKWKGFGFKPNRLFQRADQESIREDLREFFGPRAEIYLAIYDKARANKFYAISWNWAVFSRPIRGFFTARCTCLGYASSRFNLCSAFTAWWAMRRPWPSAARANTSIGS
jgi:hypothetical protein